MQTSRQNRNYTDYEASLGLSSREWERRCDQEVWRWWQRRDCRRIWEGGRDRAAYVGLSAAAGRKSQLQRGEQLKCGALTTPTCHTGSWEDERSRAGPVMRRLYWQDLIVAKDTMSHLHRQNEQESEKSLISGSTRRKAAKVGENPQL